MPGVDLNLDLPSVSDTLATIVSKLVTAVSTIADDLEAKVVPAEINVNTALGMNGSALTNLGSAQFVAGNPPTTAGSVYYNGGEFYAIDSTGTIRLTLNGALDAASIGGIGGDYGGANPANVTYDTASQEYRFKVNTTTWADLVCDDVVLMGASGSVRLSCDSGITIARQINVNELPASGISMLTYDASTSRLADAQTVRATNVVKATIVDVTGNIRHAERTNLQGFDGSTVTSGSLSFGWDSTNGAFAQSTTGGIFYVPIKAPLIPGVSRATRFELVMTQTSAPTIDFFVSTHATPPAGNINPFFFTTTSSSSGGFTKYTFTVTSPGTLLSTYRLYMKVIEGGGANTKFYSLLTAYDTIA